MTNKEKPLTTNNSSMSTAVNYIAYKVTKENYCEPEEVVGYYTTEARALQAQIEMQKTLPENGVCCNKRELVVVEKILIEA